MRITLIAGWSHSSIHREGKTPTDSSYKGVSRSRTHHHVGLMELVDMTASKAAAEKRAGSSPVADTKKTMFLKGV